MRAVVIGVIGAIAFPFHYGGYHVIEVNDDVTKIVNKTRSFAERVLSTKGYNGVFPEANWTIKNAHLQVVKGKNYKIEIVNEYDKLCLNAHENLDKNVELIDANVGECKF